MNSCCTTLQTHVRIGIDFLCSQGEIGACSRDIGMTIDTFVDPTCSNTILQIYDIQQIII